MFFVLKSFEEFHFIGRLYLCYLRPGIITFPFLFPLPQPLPYLDSMPKRKLLSRLLSPSLLVRILHEQTSKKKEIFSI